MSPSQRAPALRFAVSVATAAALAGCQPATPVFPFADVGVTPGTDTALADTALTDTALTDADRADIALPGPAVPGPAPCAAAVGGGTLVPQRPSEAREFSDRWHGGWRASPVVADLDGDGVTELLAPREGLILVYDWDGAVRLRLEVPGRVWASPIVVDLIPERPGLEIVATVRGALFAWDAQGAALAGFPVTAVDELRSLAAGDLDGDGDLELVVASTRTVTAPGAPTGDVLYAFHHDGSAVAGFPPIGGGASGCDDWCFSAGAFDQNLAVGDLDGDGRDEVVLTQDNAYFSVHRGTGEVWPSAGIFDFPTRVLGVRMMHDYALSQQGYPNDEQRDLQAHGTNSPPAIADLDGDGVPELVMVTSAQTANQLDRERGVALWVLRPDGTRPPGWESPLHLPAYLAGLGVFEGANLPEASQAVAIADIDPSPGLEVVFPGLDGQLHAASASGVLLWSLRITDSTQVLVAAPVIADLSGDGRPEIVVTTWGPAAGAHALTIVSAAGEALHRVPLPDPGSMAAPTIADANGDGVLEIVVNVSGGVDGVPQLMAFTVPGSSANCLPWPTGRGNDLRNGTIRHAQ